MLLGAIKAGYTTPEARFRLVTGLACIVVILLATLVTQNRGVWAPDELRYAQILQQMDRVSDLFVLRLWDSIYTEKPPLFFWLGRAFVPWTGGVYLSTLLAPIVLSACVLLWVTGRIAREWYGVTAGTIAVVVLGTLPLFLLLSSIGRMDMILTLFVTIGVFTFYRGYAQDSPKFRIWSFIAMGLGLLAKGPFGIVFPLAIALTALTASGKWRRLWCRETAIGLCALVAMLGCWIVPAVGIAGIGYLEKLIGKQIVERAVAGVNHGEPTYYYLWILPVILLPWVVFLIPSLGAAWRSWRKQGDERELWLLCWIGVPLIVLSLVREKLPVYLLPAMPPIAVVIARHWRDVFASPLTPGRFRLRVGWLFGFAALLGVLSLTASWINAYSPWTAATGRWHDLVTPSEDSDIAQVLLQPKTLIYGGCVLLALAGVGWIGLHSGDVRGLRWTFATLATVAPCGQLFLTLEIMPALDPGQSWREVAQAIATAQQTGEPVVSYGLRPFAAYYLTGDVTWFRRQNSLAEFVQRRGSVWCATRKQEFAEIERYCVIDRDSASQYPSPSGRVILVRLRPLAIADKSQR